MGYDAGNFEGFAATDETRRNNYHSADGINKKREDEDLGKLNLVY